MLGRSDLLKVDLVPTRKGISGVQLSHTRPVKRVIFDDPNLVSAAGLVPVITLAGQAGLASLADQHLSVPTDRGANPGMKLTSLVAGMVAGADSIDDLALLRHGGMNPAVHPHLRTLDAGIVPTVLLLRTRPTTGRGRLPLPDRPGRPDTAGRGHRPAGTGGYRRHDRRGARSPQAGRELRLQRCPGPQRRPGHGDHRPGSAGDRGPTPAQRDPAVRRAERNDSSPTR